MKNVSRKTYEVRDERLNPDFVVNHLETLITPAVAEMIEDMMCLQLEESMHSQ